MPRLIALTVPAARFWWHRFGPMFAAEIRKRRIEGMRFSRWRRHLDESFVTKTRDRKAALKFLRKSMRRRGRPEVIVTDKLRSYGAAMKEIGAADRQETGPWMNNRAENSHLPFRRRERAMLRFRRMRSFQKFAAVHSSVTNHLNRERSLSSRDIFKTNRAAALAEWRQLGAA
ncbi:DDE-type integrase/transposase/recombinase [Maritimibacter sp. 55A14]|uniref:DDE-type integrase/transposase/recombinase n=1 Tax=Maritimibacter sp. 55A14 TaxID=2174844 RepID=UPI0035139A74